MFIGTARQIKGIVCRRNATSKMLGDTRITTYRPEKYRGQVEFLNSSGDCRQLGKGMPTARVRPWIGRAF